MPKFLSWEPYFPVGQALIDAQHQALLEQCNQLARLCQTGHEAQAEGPFDQAFQQLRTMASEHFADEAAWLAASGETDLEAHRFECEEFDYLVSEIVTTENFDRLELQRFLALWWLGHITGMARNGVG